MKIIEKIVNTIINEETIIEREETAAEMKSRLDIVKEVAALQTEAETKATAKTDLLAKLGITAEEAALLLGGN